MSCTYELNPRIDCNGVILQTRVDNQKIWEVFASVADSAAEEEPTNFRIGKQLVARSRECEVSGNEDIADVGELQALLGVLLDHDDGLAFVVLEFAEDPENYVDKI